MIHLRKETDYGLVVLTHLLSEKQGRFLSAKRIAKDLKLPYPITSKVLKLLNKSNLVLSTQGSTGGYCAVDGVDQVSVGEVIEKLEGAFALTECSADLHETCKNQDHCSIRPHWVIINRVVKNVLFQLPLSALVFPTKKLPQAQTINKVWDQFFTLES